MFDPGIYYDEVGFLNDLLLAIQADQSLTLDDVPKLSPFVLVWLEGIVWRGDADDKVLDTELTPIQRIGPAAVLFRDLSTPYHHLGVLLVLLCMSA